MPIIDLPKVRVATGLYSHLDSVIRVDKKVADWIRKSDSKRPGGDDLKSLEEVVFTLKDSIKNGDMESLISKNVYEELDSLFHKREIRTGGNGNNMGRALFELGLVPLVSYPVRSRKLMLLSKKFKVACGNSFRNPMAAVRKGDPDYDHIIFESDRWRNILCWDLITSRGVFDEDFLRHAFNPKSSDIAIISYAHLLLPRYKKRTDYLMDFIKDSRPRIHLEFGLGSEESMRYAMEKFSGDSCDSWGMDEKEAKIYLKAGSENESDLIEASIRAAKEYGLKRICVHSPKFVFSVSKYDVNKEADALIAGCAVAGAKAFGRLPSKGITPVKKVSDGYNLCIVQTFFTSRPKVLTGLGDVLSAVQAVKALATRRVQPTPS